MREEPELRSTRPRPVALPLHRLAPLSPFRRLIRGLQSCQNKQHKQPPRWSGASASLLARAPTSARGGVRLLHDFRPAPLD